MSKQISDVEDMVQQKINILLVNPTDTTGIESAVTTAHKAGVVVVAVDANAKGPVDSFVGSKNYDAGLMACEALGKALGGSGEVAILDGIPVVPILERVRGCKDALAKMPGLKLVDTQNGKQERAAALSVTENMIESHPNLKGIFSVNDGGAMGSLSAIDASGKDIKLTSVDGAPEAIDAIKKPGSKFIETTAQYPRDQIRLAIGIALAKLWGAHVPAAIPVDVTPDRPEGRPDLHLVTRGPGATPRAPGIPRRAPAPVNRLTFWESAHVGNSPTRAGGARQACSRGETWARFSHSRRSRRPSWASRPCRRSTSACSAARSTPSWARTARASRPS